MSQVPCQETPPLAHERLPIDQIAVVGCARDDLYHDGDQGSSGCKCHSRQVSAGRCVMRYSQDGCLLSQCSCHRLHLSRSPAWWTKGNAVGHSPRLDAQDDGQPRMFRLVAKITSVRRLRAAAPRPASPSATRAVSGSIAPPPPPPLDPGLAGCRGEARLSRYLRKVATDGGLLSWIGPVWASAALTSIVSGGP